ncbi:response regulator [Paenibacillus flagellatus]|uniref:DNA-binding response regulator n=1 Tax=Paenibacillus flagellatus TaxID=2211139 RepID=A0A2V5KM80_9BACL|nr:response regulator [Paenibacillus flagellatus]PYI56200.1 DNA-binding response regulator [Paenibacillus flagellatus]
MNVLIVDDESVIREGIRRTIERQFPSYRVHLAGSPEEAMRVLRSNRIDIVLTDILMPGMTGLELMGLFRRRQPFVKWIVISAHSEFSYAQEAVRLGAKDYLLKPIGKERLVELIASLADERRHESEATSEAQLIKANLKYLREAILQRWASGLDIGRFDMESFAGGYPRFHLVLVRMESDKKVHLEHFTIENVLSELIDMFGKGFVASFDSMSLLGLVSLHEGVALESLLEPLRKHLKFYLKVPFQVLHSGPIDDIRTVPAEVQRMRQACETHVYEQYERGGERAIETVLHYVQSHYHEDVSLEKVASLVYLNPVYFSQLFKQKTGQGYKEYVIHVRLEHAKRLLLNPTLKLADIAEKIGYQDMRHFAQLFRKKYGATPTEYRQRMANGAEELGADSR